MMPNETALNKARHPLHWVPNFLTATRIISIPLIIYGILHVEPGGHLFARPSFVLWLFLLAGFTDFLDGFLARRWNVTTDFGRMIDPIADKLLVAACLIAFTIVTQGHWEFLIPAIAIIFRDILVSGVREHAALSSIVMPPTKLAKWKTACEMLAIFILMFWIIASASFAQDGIFPPIVGLSYQFGLGLLWLAAGLSVYTGQLYFRAALRNGA